MMNYLFFLVTLIIGIALGFALAFIFKIIQMKTGREIAGELYSESEEIRRREREEVIGNLKASFGDISLEALNKTADQVIKLTEGKFKTERDLHSHELDSKKSLIDDELKRLTEKLDRMSTIMNEFEKDREKKFGELSKHLEETGKRTNDLIATTNTLRDALAHSKARGQWGERMAEDVLRLAGFVENVNYMKQKAFGSSGTIPDFTFLLPRNLFLNMDVKFPLDNYMRYLDAGNDSEKESCKRSFLRDVRTRIQEITSREYINPEMNTVDYVLLFIPNEQIFGFIQEEDRTLIDMSLEKRVIVCSPLTLFAVLAVIRAAVDNFALEQKANRMLSLLGAFKTQWGKFVEGLEKVGKRIEAAQKEYDSLNTTRRRQLEKPLAEIDALREQQGLESENYPLELQPPENNESSEDTTEQ